MPQSETRIEKLTPHIGAEVHGVDLSRPLDEPTFKQVHDALIENSVIFFRDQRPMPRIAEGLRPALLGTSPCIPPRPASWRVIPILVIHADENSGSTWPERTGTRTCPATRAPMGSASLHARAAAGGRRHPSPACTPPTRHCRSR